MISARAAGRAACVLLVPICLAALSDNVAMASEEVWVTTYRNSALYAHAEGAEQLGSAPQWTSYRVDGPTLAGRTWVWSPYTRGHGWLPVADAGPGRPPTTEELLGFWRKAVLRQLAATAASARDYLFAAYPDLAPRLDCIAMRESNWRNIPNFEGSGAFGPFQFMRTTFAATPTGRNGGDWRNPFDQVDAAADLLRAGRAYEWEVVLFGLC